MKFHFRDNDEVFISETPETGPKKLPRNLINPKKVTPPVSFHFSSISSQTGSNSHQSSRGKNHSKQPASQSTSVPYKKETRLKKVWAYFVSLSSCILILILLCFSLSIRISNEKKIFF